MKKNIMLTAVFLTLSLGLAYWASLPSKDIDSSESTWMRLDQGSVGRVSYTDKKIQVEVYRNSKAGNQFWCKTEEISASQEGGESKVTVFKASEQFSRVLEFFEPLRVKRVIGNTDSVNVAEFGFDGDDTAKLKIFDLSGKEILSFTLGKRSFGSRNYFAIDDKQKKVLLFNGSRVENLSKAKTEFYERSPYDIDFNDVDAAELVVGDKTKSFWRSKKDDSGALGWSDADDAATVKISYEGWMRKLQGIRIVSYQEAVETALLDTTRPLFTLEFKRKGTVVETVKVAKVQSDGGKFDYWIHSRYLASWAKVNGTKAETLEKDVPVILGES